VRIPATQQFLDNTVRRTVPVEIAWSAVTSGLPLVGQLVYTGVVATALRAPASPGVSNLLSLCHRGTTGHFPNTS
jgi:hypothetical protein